MRKGSQVIGTPIVSFDTGEKIDKIHDVIFDQQSNSVLALLVDEGGWFSKARVVRWEDVQALGPDAIIIARKEQILMAQDVPVVREILERNNVTKGTKIMTTDGRDLGTIVDLYFNEESGAIEGYEVSGGLFADAYSGRSFVPAPETLSIGEDVAFVPPETADLMEDQVGGIKGAVQTQTEKLSEVAAGAQERGRELNEKAREQVGDATAKLQDSTSTLMEQAKEKAASAGQQGQDALQSAQERLGIGGTMNTPTDVQAAKGRRANALVATEDGRIIAAPGQIVTEAVITSSVQYGMQDELLQATASERPQQSGTMTQSVEQSKERLGEEAKKITDGAKSTLERLREKLSDAQERGQDEAEDRSIKRALGRPVTRVILAPDDSVILNAGELITHRAVELSRNTGVLDVLLSSVSMAEPDVSQDQLKANGAGEASLDRLLPTQPENV